MQSIVILPFLRQRKDVGIRKGLQWVTLGGLAPSTPDPTSKLPDEQVPGEARITREGNDGLFRIYYRVPEVEIVRQVR